MNTRLSTKLRVVTVVLAAANSGWAAEPAETLARGGGGPVGDGVTLNTVRFQATIDALAAAGGGRMVIPKGVFVSGALFFKLGVHLHLEEGAVLKGSTDVKDYPKRMTRIEGHFEEWLPALVNAEKCDGLRVTGSGTLDGSGAPFWKAFWDARRADSTTKNLDVPRPRLMYVRESKDVEVSGVTFKDSSFWNLHLYKCSNVRVEKVRFEVPNGERCPSTDGTDVDSCQDVTIKDCHYRVDDDCIALKGSKGPLAMEDKDSPPVERIRIIECTFERGGGVTLGSEATTVRDVTVEDCKWTGAASILRLKLRPDTPQVYENIFVRRCIGEVDNGRLLYLAPWRQYFDLQGQPPPKSVVRNVVISDVKGKFGSWGELAGNAGQTQFGEIRFENVDVTLKNAKFPSTRPATLVMKDVKVNGESVTP